ncbi:MAG: alpha/beta hydrolase [Clostridia bacterium]|nr:alpha/beta hydrolase [Clostridia bacterium]
MSLFENGTLNLPGMTMDYIRFGRGKTPLVMIPGVGDGLRTVKGMAIPFAFLYRSLARDFTVYVFSRERQLSPKMSTREMAEHLNTALEALGLSSVMAVGVSQGGMIAQWLAIDHPERIERLVLVVTLSRPNETVRQVIARWIGMAERGDFRGIMQDTAERSYSEKRLRQMRRWYMLAGLFGKSSSMERFLIQAESCLTHDAYECLDRILCPTLVIGGEEDQIVTGQASVEMAGRIPGAQLVMVEKLGHGLYEEAPDFLQRVQRFCLDGK